VGLTLAVVIALEVGDVTRFPDAERLASYAGTTPRVRASGGKTRDGRLRPDVNRYLKWACEPPKTETRTSEPTRPRRRERRG
jgi:transposase